MQSFVVFLSRVRFVLVALLLGQFVPAVLAQTATVTNLTLTVASPNALPTIPAKTIVTASATVQAGGPVTAGYVQFRDGNQVLTTAAIPASGTVTLSQTYFGSGPHSLTAAYLGNTAFAPSVSTAQPITVLGTDSLDLRSGLAPCDQFLQTYVPGLYSPAAPTGKLTYTNLRTSLVSGQQQMVATSKVVSIVGGAESDIPVATDGSATTLGTASGAFNTALALGDLNNDGIADYVIASGTPSITIANGAPTGRIFAGTPRLTIPLGANALGVATGDFNHDGLLDIAVALDNGTVQFLMGNGDLTFTPRAGFASIVAGLGTAAKAIAAGDFDGDGFMDVAVADAPGNVFVVTKLNNGTGSVQTINIGAAVSALAVGDFNGDGLQDLAVTVKASGTVQVFLAAAGNPAGAFGTAASSTVAVGTAPSAIAAADFNHDGLLDLAVSNSGANTVTVLRGAGGGTFAAVATLPTLGNLPTALAATDFNQDQKLDILVVNYGDGTGGTTQYRTNPLNNNVALLTGDGNFGFTNAIPNSELTTAGQQVVGRPISIAVSQQADDATPLFTVVGAPDPTTPGSNGTISNYSYQQVYYGGIGILKHQYATDQINLNFVPDAGVNYAALTSAYNTNTGDTTSVTVTSPVIPSSPAYGAPVVLSALVANLSSGAAPSGTVAFCAGNNYLGSAPLAGNTATLSSSIVPSDTTSITALFLSGTPSTIKNAVSTPVSFAVPPPAPATVTPVVSLTLSATSVPIGTPVTFTATIPAATNGTVTFYNGFAPLVTLPVGAAGSVTFTTTLAAGAYTITARYSGNNVLLPASASAPLSVSDAAPTTTLNASGDPCSTYTLSAMVASGNGSISTPLSGNVRFFDVTKNLDLGLVPITPSSMQPLQFAPEKRITLGTGGAFPQYAITEDFDRDGKLDLALNLQDLNAAGNSGILFHGTGDGNFTEQTGIPLSPGSPIVSTDVNNDGFPDLINTVTENTGFLQIVPNTSTAGTISFGNIQQYNLEAGLVNCTTGDFTGNGRNDIACIAGDGITQEANIYVELNQLDTSNNHVFVVSRLPNSATTDPAFGIATDYFNFFTIDSGDVNNDGHRDLIIRAAGTGSPVSILLGNGDGTFRKAPGSGFPSDPANSLFSSGDTILGDFNGDGKMDLAIANLRVATNGGSNNVALFLGNGDGSFNYSGAIAPLNAVYSHLYGGDLNGDGKFDLLLLHDDSFTTFIGNGNGTFVNDGDTLIGAGYQPSFLSIADVDGDGKSDIISVNFGVDNITVLINTTPSTPTGTAVLPVPATGVLNGVALYGDLVTAIYQNDSVYPTSPRSNTVTLAKQASATSVVASPSPAVAGRPATLTATITTACATDVPTGTVNFLQGTTLLGTAAVTSTGGVTTATLVTSALTAGSSVITANYSGDNVNAPSSGTVNLTVASTAVVITYLPNPANQVYGTPIAAGSLNATAKDANGNAVAGTFVYTTTVGGATVRLTAGSNILPVNTYLITAAFTPTNTVLYGSGTATAGYAVTKAPTTLALTSSANPQIVGQPVTFTASVASSVGVPAGSVTFFDGTTAIGTAPLSATGVAAITTSGLSGGIHIITATYAGSATYLPSSNVASLAQSISDYTVGSTTPTITVNPSATGVFTITVTPAAGSPFNGPVTLSVTGLPGNSNSSFAPVTVTPGGSTATSALSVQTYVSVTSSTQSPASTPYGGIAAALLLPLLLVRRVRRSVPRGVLYLLLLCGSLGATTLLTSCGGGYFGPKPAQYVLTVTGTSGSLQRSTTVTLNVQ